MTPHRRLVAARIAYVTIVLLATLHDLAFAWDSSAAAERLARALTLSLHWADVIDGLRNVALFAGLGSVWVVTSGALPARRHVLQATGAGLVLSVFVEGLQAFSPNRTASFVDVGTNVAGALAGAVIVTLLIIAVSRAKGARSYFGVPTLLLSGAYFMAVLFEALTPLFKSAPLTGIGGGPRHRLRLALSIAFPLSFDEIPFSDVPLFAAAGFLGALALAERGKLRSGTLLPLALVMCVLVGAAQIAHGASGLAVRWEAIAIDVLSIGAGAWAASRWIPRLSQTLTGPVRPRVAIVAYAILLAIWGWRPFFPETRLSVITAQMTAERLVPLLALAQRRDVFSAAHVAQQFLLYFPLGALLAVWPLRMTGRLAHLWSAVWLALAVELGHFFVLGRFFDMTNVILACAGLAMGWIVVRRAGFVPHGEAWRASPRSPRAAAHDIG